MGSSGYKAQARAQTQAAQLQSSAALQVAQMQTDAALQAAIIGQQTSLEAAHIAAGGGIMAAQFISGATEYSADLQFEAAEKAIEEQRRQYDNTTEMLSPYVQTGEKFLKQVERASTLDGFAARLEKIMDSDTYDDLRQNRQEAAAGALGQAGLTRSGVAAQTASDITTELAFAIEGQDYSRKVNQVNIGQAAAARQANINMGSANAISGIYMGTAQNVGNQTVQGAIAGGGYMAQGANAAAGFYSQGGQAQAQGIMNAAYYGGQGIMGSANAIGGGMINGANAMAAGRAGNWNMGMQLLGQGMGAAAMFFSDERLKKDLKAVGKISGLTLYEWEWVDEVKGLVGTEMVTGFRAQEVESHYPDCVTVIGDVKAIDYPRLHKHLLDDIKEAA